MAAEAKIRKSKIKIIFKKSFTVSESDFLSISAEFFIGDKENDHFGRTALQEFAKGFSVECTSLHTIQ